jgi:hypothetical protein
MTTTTNITNIPILFNTIESQNKVIQSKIESQQSEKRVDNQLTFYDVTSSEVLNTYNVYLYYIYYLCLLIVSVFIIQSKKTIPIKVGIIIVFVLFPYIIYPIEKVIYEILRWIYVFFRSTIYE